MSSLSVLVKSEPTLRVNLPYLSLSTPVPVPGFRTGTTSYTKSSGSFFCSNSIRSAINTLISESCGITSNIPHFLPKSTAYVNTRLSHFLISSLSSFNSFTNLLTSLSFIDFFKRLIILFVFFESLSPQVFSLFSSIFFKLFIKGERVSICFFHAVSFGLFFPVKNDGNKPPPTFGLRRVYLDLLNCAIIIYTYIKTNNLKNKLLKYSFIY